MKPILAILGAVLLLGGCAQNYGVTHVTATFAPNGKIQSMDWATGTEKSHVKVKANVQTGEVEYSADDVLAFRGQEIAAGVYKELSAAGVNVTEAIVRGAVGAALGTAAISGLGDMAAGSAALDAAKLKAAAAGASR